MLTHFDRLVNYLGAILVRQMGVSMPMGSYADGDVKQWRYLWWSL
jgi:hypothetical protein